MVKWKDFSNEWLRMRGHGRWEGGSGIDKTGEAPHQFVHAHIETFNVLYAPHSFSSHPAISQLINDAKEKN